VIALEILGGGAEVSRRRPAHDEVVRVAVEGSGGEALERRKPVAVLVLVRVDMTSERPCLFEWVWHLPIEVVPRRVHC
jgi:hypothetical protein